MATNNEVSLTRNQRSELSSIAQSRSLPAGYVFRAKLILMLAEGASFTPSSDSLQTTAPTIIRWKQRFLESGLDGLDTYHPGQKATVSDSGSAGPDSGGHAQETQRRFHPLELPQTGGGAGCQQGRGASRLERSRPEASPPGALHGQRRSGLRTQSRRHHRPVSESAAACGRVLRR